ncbi:TetR/AcrR family transcriptional regulator [Lentzea flaviverrucosa]|uniref:Transcriptional regulator, TetR family n=1 Tax=Lentzea flaviverrucosa TaxID=200379 RepID=A0A1H9GR97_9PSEU|nr:TetR/AcrR family transcriptional regulator [Lentzea flaviverrucosa]RDI34823.1 TetR family transcriptional regulator [Lentzea flaviverrucosa]SEQ52615.1 transcriptional regulator, TetR family [Lentzea flaviverrucosa]
MAGHLSQKVRSDARYNRDHILDVAREVFAAEGLNAPMREVARRAGVGPATLYRHFPTKEALATEAFSDQMQACDAILAEGLADPDPWRAFRTVIEKICEVHARGFTTAFTANFPHAIDFAAHRERSLVSIAELARRAKRAGGLRPDFVLDDLILVLMANGGIHATSETTRAAASRRFAALVIQAFQASPTHTPLPALR